MGHGVGGGWSRRGRVAPPLEVGPPKGPPASSWPLGPSPLLWEYTPPHPPPPAHGNIGNHGASAGPPGLQCRRLVIGQGGGWGGALDGRPRPRPPAAGASRPLTPVILLEKPGRGAEPPRLCFHPTPHTVGQGPSHLFSIVRTYTGHKSDDLPALKCTVWGRQRVHTIVYHPSVRPQNAAVCLRWTPEPPGSRSFGISHSLPGRPRWGPRPPRSHAV